MPENKGFSEDNFFDEEFWGKKVGVRGSER